MNNLPLISIIIPIYNSEIFLKECIDSVINQTYKNLEIICVNDGSKDSSLEILKEYESKDGRIVIVDKLNEGVAKARNDGVDLSKGEYIMFLDSDDWIEPETCEEAYNAIKQKDSDICFFTYMREFKCNSKVKNIYDEPIRFFNSDECKNVLCKRVLGLSGEDLRYPENMDAISTLWGKLYKTSLIKENKLRVVDTSAVCTSEDTLFNIWAFYYAKGAVYINIPLWHYRKYNANSITTGYKARLFDGWNNLHTRMQEFIDENDCDESFQRSLYNRIALGLIGLGLNIMSSDKGVMWKISQINSILKEKKYVEAYKNLDFKYFPIHWKAFFFCAKIRFSFGVYVLLYAMIKMMGK
ncbi:MAG: glycosyltransferase family 2 protein [Oscillospiraceae bacterium]|nr:glycosyltransferase family 2 protein [Oscillospiraceae bacterium]